MKTRISLMLAFLCWAQWSKAQVSVTTVYDDPMKNTWSGGVFLGADFQSHTGGLMLGLDGRYTLAKLATFSVNLGYDYTRLVPSGGLVNFDEALVKKLPAYTNFEFRGAIHLKEKEGTLSSKIKMGRGATQVAGKTGSVKYSTTHKTNARVVTAATFSVNVQNRFASQEIADSMKIFNIEDPNSTYKLSKESIYVKQSNLLLGAGIQFGQYSWFKGKFSGTAVSNATRRVRKSLVGNIELLYALTINTGDEAFQLNKDKNLITYKLKDVEKRRLGFRITTDYGANKPGLYQRMEIGYRPGVWAPAKQSNFLNQGYVVYGIGLGF